MIKVKVIWKLLFFIVWDGHLAISRLQNDFMRSFKSEFRKDNEVYLCRLNNLSKIVFELLCTYLFLFKQMVSHRKRMTVIMFYRKF